LLNDILSVGVIGNKHICSRKQIIANDNFIDSRNVRMCADDTIISNNDFRGERLAVEFTPCRQLYLSIQCGVFANADVLESPKDKGTVAKSGPFAPMGKTLIIK
jgi:hypothetical protein